MFSFPLAKMQRNAKRFCKIYINKKRRHRVTSLRRFSVTKKYLIYNINFSIPNLSRRINILLFSKVLLTRLYKSLPKSLAISH